MPFQPRIHENGGNCCCDYTKNWEPLPPTNPCPKCLEHFAALELHTVPELRTAASTLTIVEIARRLDLQLRRVDDGFMRIVDADVEAGKGTYEARANGRTVTKSFTFDVIDGTTVVLLSPTFAAAEAPDPYEGGLAQLRAAAATDRSRFEDEWKAKRLAALEAEHARTAAHIEATPSPRLTTAELSEFAAPDPYREGLQALKLRSGK